MKHVWCGQTTGAFGDTLCDKHCAGALSSLLSPPLVLKVFMTGEQKSSHSGKRKQYDQVHCIHTWRGSPGHTPTAESHMTSSLEKKKNFCNALCHFLHEETSYFKTSSL